MLISCSKPTPHFTVEAELPQIGTQSLTVVYTTDDGNRHAIPITAVDGHFEFEGNAQSPSTVEIFTSKGQFYLAIIAQNGQHIAVSGTPGEFKAEGNTMAQQLLSYTPGDDTVGLPEAVRRAIESIHLTAPQPSGKFVAPEVWVKKDSVTRFPLQGIWVFTSSDKERTPALLDTLRHYARKKGSNVCDVFIGTDLWSWQSLTRRDSATWQQGLALDAPVALAGIITSTPMLVEVDSAARVIRLQPLQ